MSTLCLLMRYRLSYFYAGLCRGLSSSLKKSGLFLSYCPLTSAPLHLHPLSSSHLLSIITPPPSLLTPSPSSLLALFTSPSHFLFSPSPIEGALRGKSCGVRGGSSGGDREGKGALCRQTQLNLVPVSLKNQGDSHSSPSTPSPDLRQRPVRQNRL